MEQCLITSVNKLHSRKKHKSFCDFSSYKSKIVEVEIDLKTNLFFLFTVCFAKETIVRICFTNFTYRKISKSKSVLRSQFKKNTTSPYPRIT